MHLFSFLLNAVWFVSFTLALSETCSTLEPQPIGIDFGFGKVIAGYANSPENVTLLAMTGEKEAYSRHVSRLRLEFIRKMNLEKAFRPAPLKASLIDVFVVFFKPYFIQLRAQLTFLDHPAIQIPAKHISDVLSYIKNIIMAVIEYRPFAQVDEMTLDDVYNGFVSALESIKDKSFSQHNQTIYFAMFSVPDFFNTTICSLLISAARDLGIASVENPIPRTIAAAWGAGVSGDTRALILDQGKHYMNIRTFQEEFPRSYKKSKISQRSLPLDPYASHTLDRNLLRRVIQVSPVLRKQLELGASEDQLGAEIARARIKIKNFKDEESLMEDADENKDYHHDEWPLELKDWWLGEEEETVLKWQDVEKIETDYVKGLSVFISDMLIEMKEVRVKKKSHVPETIDTAVITTDHFDGPLLKRAVIKATGLDVKISGGGVGSSTLAAKGIALGALRRRNYWKELNKPILPWSEPVKEQHSEL